MINKILLSLSLIVTLTHCAASTGSKLIGTTAPATRLTMIDGNMITLRSLQGKPTVLAFWASTCTFSPKAIERLDRYARTIPPGRVRFIAVSLDKTEELPEIRKMVGLRDMDHYEHAMSGNAEYDEAYQAFGGRELPYYVVLNAEQTVMYAGTDMSAVQESVNQLK